MIASNAKRIAVIGSGYVGLVTGACLAELGHQVVCIENDVKKLEILEGDAVPFYEPGLGELIARNRVAGRIRFASSVAAGIGGAEIAFIAVGTPMSENGDADLRYVFAAAREIATAITSDTIVVTKSTVPISTGDRIAEILAQYAAPNVRTPVVSNPEFLREGSAIWDFLNPDRIVVGTSSVRARCSMVALYAGIDAPVICTDLRTAEMIKYAANSFLATKISFINEIAGICEAVGADVRDVVKGAGSDKRIGTEFLSPGLGFGGSCFPKDVSALRNIALSHDIETHVLDAVVQTNAAQIARMQKRLTEALGTLADRTIGMLGLAFKPQTDDVRESPAIALIDALLAAGARVVVHDPIAMKPAGLRLGERVAYAQNSYDAVRDADAVVLATEWAEYRALDFAHVKSLMRGTWILDTRNALDAEYLRECGLEHIGVGHQGGISPHRSEARLAPTRLRAPLESKHVPTPLRLAR